MKEAILKPIGSIVQEQWMSKVRGRSQKMMISELGGAAARSARRPTWRRRGKGLVDNCTTHFFKSGFARIEAGTQVEGWMQCNVCWRKESERKCFFSGKSLALGPASEHGALPDLPASTCRIQIADIKHFNLSAS